MPSGREWHGVAGASDEALGRLQAACPRELPASYVALLSFSNGGEGPLPVQPLWVCLDSAETVSEALVKSTHEEFFPGFFVFGSNGGGEYLALDMRKAAPFPVVSIDMTNIDLRESVMTVATDFSAFVELIGLDG